MLILAQLRLRLHNGIFAGYALRCQLGEVGFRHLAHFHHRAPAFLILFAGLQTLTVHLDGFGHVEYLHEELGDGLLNVVRGLVNRQFRLFCRQLVNLQRVGVLTAVPYRPLRIHVVRTAIVRLVCTRLVKRTIAHTLIGAGRHRGQQGSS